MDCLHALKKMLHLHCNSLNDNEEQIKLQFLHILVFVADLQNVLLRKISSPRCYYAKAH